MANQGASLQNYNNELVKCVEDLREKREEINRQILKEEEEKAKIQRDLSILTDRLSTINESLARKVMRLTLSIQSDPPPPTASAVATAGVASA